MEPVSPSIIACRRVRLSSMPSMAWPSAWKLLSGLAEVVLHQAHRDRRRDSGVRSPGTAADPVSPGRDVHPRCRYCVMKPGTQPPTSMTAITPPRRARHGAGSRQGVPASYRKDLEKPRLSIEGLAPSTLNFSYSLRMAQEPNLSCRPPPQANLVSSVLKED